MQGFLTGMRKPSKSKAEEGRAPQAGAERVDRRRLVYVGATAVVVAIALLLVVFGNRGSALQRCNGVILQQQRNSCLEALASAEMNASICGYIGYAPRRYDCLSSVAIASSNATLCTKINDTASSAACVTSISNSTRDIGYCSLLREPYNSTCAFGMASASGFAHAGDCLLIANSSQRSTCMALNGFRSAVVGLNASFCAGLPDSSNTSLLSSMVSMSNPHGAQAMELSLLNATPRSYCYYSLAVQIPDRSLCNLTSGYMYLLCNSTFSGHVNATPANATSLSTCGYIPDYLRPLCEYGIVTAQAIEGRNASVCLQISITQYQYSCMASLASKYGNASYCALIGNSTVKQSCEFGAAHGASAPAG